jgi:hypothetical protein
MPENATLTVVYTGEPDEVTEFSQNGQSRTFGRDDARCEIVIWSAINGRDLSRVAGRIWRMEDELWLRNLSSRHELTIAVPDLPAEPPLPPRSSPIDPGPARSIPAGLAYVRGPAGCELLVRQIPGRISVPEMSDFNGETTSHAPPVPTALMPVAAALCEPLLAGGQLPATYAEITRRAGLGSIRRTRGLVGRLCRLYAAETPQLQERIIARLQREQATLHLPVEPTLQSGVWRFERASNGAVESREVRRRRALALPDYYEVAHLLVRRRLVAREDVALLTGPTSTTATGATPDEDGE